MPSRGIRRSIEVTCQAGYPTIKIDLDLNREARARGMPAVFQETSKERGEKQQGYKKKSLNLLHSSHARRFFCSASEAVPGCVDAMALAMRETWRRCCYETIDSRQWRRTEAVDKRAVSLDRSYRNNGRREWEESRNTDRVEERSSINKLSTNC